MRINNIEEEIFLANLRSIQKMNDAIKKAKRYYKENLNDSLCELLKDHKFTIDENPVMIDGCQIRIKDIYISEIKDVVFKVSYQGRHVMIDDTWSLISLSMDDITLLLSVIKFS